MHPIQQPYTAGSTFYQRSVTYSNEVHQGILNNFYVGVDYATVHGIDQSIMISTERNYHQRGIATPLNPQAAHWVPPAHTGYISGPTPWVDHHSNPIHSASQSSYALDNSIGHQQPVYNRRKHHGRQRSQVKRNLSSVDDNFYSSNYQIYQSSNPPSSSQKSSGKQRSQIPIDGFIYQVQFKRAHRNYILAPSAPRDLLPGEFVKVEADRGEDMGIVLAKCPIDSFEEVVPTAGYRGRGFSSGQSEKKYLFRRATLDERASLYQKVVDEEKALQYIRERSLQMGFPMAVLDAEYQFDRHKLTFYFEADKRIDFRDLVNELFSLYKTRIWMQQVDISTVSPHDPGLELARVTGFLSSRDDLFSGKGSIHIEENVSGNSSLSGSTEAEQSSEKQLKLDQPHYEWYDQKTTGSTITDIWSPLSRT